MRRKSVDTQEESTGALGSLLVTCVLRELSIRLSQSQWAFAVTCIVTVAMHGLFTATATTTTTTTTCACGALLLDHFTSRREGSTALG